jgi:hypothetical protein
MKLKFIQATSAAAAAVSISFSAPEINWFVLQKLKGEKPCGCDTLASGSEYTALAYCVFDAVRDKLIGSPDAQMKSKTTCVSMGFCHGNFIISYVCQPSLTAVRKSLGLALSRMDAGKMYPRYQKYMRLLGGKPNRDEFDYCVAMLDVEPNIVICAKTDITKDKLKAIQEVVEKKLPEQTKGPKGVKPESFSKDMGETEYPTVSGDGVSSMFVLDFLDAIQVPALFDGKNIILYTKNKVPADASKIERYTASSYGKLKDKINQVAVFSATSRGLLCFGHLGQLENEKLTPSSIASMIKKALL